MDVCVVVNKFILTPGCKFFIFILSAEVDTGWGIGGCSGVGGGGVDRFISSEAYWGFGAILIRMPSFNW